MADRKRLHHIAEKLCETRVLLSHPPNDSSLYCPPLWDGWGCWNYTRADHVTFIDCPAYIEGFDSKYKAHRYCTEEGEWWRAPTTNRTWANYTGCVDLSDLQEGKRVIQLYITGYTISILSLIIALAIFTYFRQLQCRRVTLHKNLFTCYILNGIVWILYYSLVAMNSSVIDNNPIWCQAVHCLAQYFTTCNFFWMFCEGLYLHTVIVVAFVTGKKLVMACYLLGWGVPVLTTAVYTLTRALSAEAVRCWLDDSDFAYIIFGPIIATLILNMIFMFNIVRVLITKLRAVNSPDTVQTRKAVRAALILIPLLGLQFVMYPVEPPPDSSWLFYYQLITAFVTSFQGLFVAVIFCFCNGEVMSVIRRRWGQHRLMRSGSKSRPSFQTQATYMETTVQPTNFSTSGVKTSANNKRGGNTGLLGRIRSIGSNPLSARKPSSPTKLSSGGENQDRLLAHNGSGGGHHELNGCRPAAEMQQLQHTASLPGVNGAEVKVDVSQI